MPNPNFQDTPLVQRIQAAHPDAISGGNTGRGELTLEVKLDQWRPLAQFLKADGFNFLSDLTCVDWLPSEPRFEIVAHLYSLKRHEFVRIKTRCNEDVPPLSLIPVWPSANWFEREVFDLFGIRFGEHPNLTRMLMPEAWVGYPLRKDYPVEGPR